MTLPTIQEGAQFVLEAIDNDIAKGDVPWHVQTFTELHDHVDANAYLIAWVESAGEKARLTQNLIDTFGKVVEHVERHLTCRTENCEIIYDSGSLGVLRVPWNGTRTYVVRWFDTEQREIAWPHLHQALACVAAMEFATEIAGGRQLAERERLAEAISDFCCEATE